MLIRTTFVLSLLILSACSHLYSVQDFESNEQYQDRINRECADENIVVTLLSGDEFEAEFIEISYDSLLLENKDSAFAIASSNVNKLTYYSTTGGMFRGLAGGVVAGIATGIGIAMQDEPESGYAAVGLFILESAAGLITGAIKQDERSFIINAISYKIDSTRAEL